MDLKSFFRGRFARAFGGGGTGDGRRPRGALFKLALAAGVVVVAGYGIVTGVSNIAASRDEAKTRIAAMTTEEIKTADAGVMADLLEKLWPYFDSDSYRKVYRHLPLDPGYLDHYAAQRKALDTWLRTSPEIAKARADWAKAGDDERLKLLVPIRDKQAEILGFSAEKAPMTLFSQGRDSCTTKEGQSLSFVTYGYYDGRYLNLNTHPDSAWPRFQEVLDTVIHEQEHHYQRIIDRDFSDGKLTAKAPRNEYRLISVNENYYYSPGCSAGMEAYYTYTNQPMEADARLYGKLAVDAMKALDAAGGRTDKAQLRAAPGPQMDVDYRYHLPPGTKPPRRLGPAL
jgi:hypothetical protein